MRPQTWLLIFFGKETQFRNKFMEIVKDFDVKKVTTTTVNPGKSSRIFRVKPNLFIFIFFIIFLDFSHFFHFSNVARAVT